MMRAVTDELKTVQNLFSMVTAIHFLILTHTYTYFTAHNNTIYSPVTYSSKEVLIRSGIKKKKKLVLEIQLNQKLVSVTNVI